MLNWSLEKRKLKDLKDHKKNPRRLTEVQEKHLRTSLEKFGLIDKIIINQDGTIIGGHQRKRTLKKMGLKEVDCYVPERLLDEKEVEELNIRLNKNTGEWDYEILANEWEVPDLLDWGFTVDELQLTEPEIIEDETEEDEKKKTKTCPNCGHDLS